MLLFLISSPCKHSLVIWNLRPGWLLILVDTYLVMRVSNLMMTTYSIFFQTDSISFQLFYSFFMYIKFSENALSDSGKNWQQIFTEGWKNWRWLADYVLLRRLHALCAFGWERLTIATHYFVFKISAKTIGSIIQVYINKKIQNNIYIYIYNFSELPLLSTGVGIYRSELLLDGMVTQKLEYQRLFFFSPSELSSCISMERLMFEPFSVSVSVPAQVRMCLHFIFYGKYWKWVYILVLEEKDLSSLFQHIFVSIECRYRLFARHVKRTRATMRLIKESEYYRPVAKCK